MKYFFLSLLMVLNVMAAGEPARVEAKTAYNQVVRINEICTGTIIAQNLVLTASHCIEEGMRPIPVEFLDGHTALFKPIYVGKWHSLHDPSFPNAFIDFALLDGATGTIKPFPVLPTNETALLPKLSLYISMRRPREQRALPCVVVKVHKEDPGVSLATFADIFPGDSGSAILDEHKHVIGIISVYVTNQRFVGFSVPISGVQLILRQMGRG